MILKRLKIQPANSEIPGLPLLTCSYLTFPFFSAETCQVKTKACQVGIFSLSHFTFIPSFNILQEKTEKKLIILLFKHKIKVFFDKILPLRLIAQVPKSAVSILFDPYFFHFLSPRQTHKFLLYQKLPEIIAAAIKMAESDKK